MTKDLAFAALKILEKRFIFTFRTFIKRLAAAILLGYSAGTILLRLSYCGYPTAAILLRLSYWAILLGRS